MEEITLEWLISRKILGRIGDSFGTSYSIYSYKTKVVFVYERKGSVRVYIHQSDDDTNDFSNVVLLGIVNTEKEAEEIFKTLTRGKTLC